MTLVFIPNDTLGLLVEAVVPLMAVRVRATVMDMVARVTVTQVYANQFALVPLEACYRFPLPERAAVCAFEARIDGRRICGVVKERNEAVKTYETAISQGKSAFLLEQETVEIFTMSVGNIPPCSAVEVDLTYVADLKSDINDAIRFVLPTSIAPRYVPAGECDAVFAKPDAPRSIPYLAQTFCSSGPYCMDIIVQCKMTDVVKSLSSPSHPIAPQTELSWVSSSFAPNSSAVIADMSIRFREATMDRDFILLVRAKGMDRPRTMVEHHPVNNTYAAMLTFVPKFSLTEVPSELIFVVDRSGSMSGSRIKAAKEALELLVRSLPEDCFFNIVSFGNEYSLLFETSQRYNQISLYEAIRHVQRIDANMGGTELMSPIEDILSSEKPRKNKDDKPLPSTTPNDQSDYKRQIFILTDGEVGNTEAIIDKITQFANSTRIFTLGIGNSVSHALVEGMARAGRGDAQYVDNKVDPVKLLTQLKRATHPELTDLKIHWTEASKLAYQMTKTESSSIKTINNTASSEKPHATPLWNASSGSDSSASAPLPLPEPDLSSRVQVAPFLPPPIFPDSRFISFAIFSDKTDIPKSVFITGNSPDGPVELEIDVPAIDASTQDTMIHTLAARATIRDLETGVSYLHGLQNGRSMYDRKSNELDEITKEIIRLGIGYGLTSKHTAYVAVDESSSEILPLRPQPAESVDGEGENIYSTAGLAQMPCFSVVDHTGVKVAESNLLNRGYRLEVMQDLSVSPMQFNKRSRPIFGNLFSIIGKMFSGGGSSNNKSTSRSHSSAPSVTEAESMPSFSAPYGPDSVHNVQYGSLVPEMDEALEVEEKSVKKSNYGYSSESKADGGNHDTSAKTSVTFKDIVQLQQFDGSFPGFDARLMQIIEKLFNLTPDRLTQAKQMLQSEPFSHFAAALLATTVAVILLETHFAADEDKWMLIAGKARKWMAKSHNHDQANDYITLLWDTARMWLAAF